MSQTDTPLPVAAADFVRILDEFLAARAAGKAVGKEELLRAHPKLAVELDACLASLDFIGNAMARDRANAGTSQECDQLLEIPAESIGEFRIIREIGRGGMGVVYEAEQLSLARRVALKVLPFASILESRQIQRFKNEARAVASLSHPHIISVYQVGCDRGIHYYAMQYVAGRTLAELIRSRQRHDRVQQTCHTAEQTCPIGSLSTLRGAAGAAQFRSLARMIGQAAEALQYAHETGIVHRDVKPSNLIVDAEGSVFLTDFGLAMMPADAGLTMTGDLLGTLSYMSPEQAAGKREAIDSRTDIYSLGATLYELLTGRKVFAESDRRLLLRRIIEVDPTPPRSVVPNIPRDLETITLKAIAKSPRERYASMAEFAADLDRFVHSRPVTARRPTWPDRTAKWVRRHFLITGSAAAVVCVAAIALMIAYRHEATLGRQSQEQLRVAEESSQFALDITFDVLQGLTNDILFIPNTSAIQRQAIDQALQLHRDVAATEVDSRAARLTQLSIARLLMMRVENSFNLGAPIGEDAIAALEILKDLASENPADLTIRGQLANACMHYGQHLRQEMRYCEAVEVCSQAEQLSVEPIPLWWTGRVASLHHAGRSRESRDAMLTRLAEVQELERLRNRFGMASVFVRNTLVPSSVKLGEWAQALHYSEQILVALAQDDIDTSPGPASVRAQWFNARERIAAGTVLVQMQEPARAKQLFGEAVAILEALSRSNQEFWWRRRAVAWSHLGLADALVVLNEAAPVEHELRQGVAHLESAGLPIDLYQAALGRYRLAQFLVDQGQITLAANELAIARDVFTRIAEEYPHEPFRNLRLAMLLTMAPLPEFRNPELAIRVAERALRRDSGVHARYFALAELRTGAWEAAIKSARTAISLRSGGDAIDQLILSLAYARSGAVAEARQAWQQAVASRNDPIYWEELGPLAVNQLFEEARCLLEPAPQKQHQASAK